MAEISREDAIKNLKEMFPKKCKMVDGRYRGGFDDYECDKGQALCKAISDMQKLAEIEQIVKYNDFNYTEDCSGCPFEKEEDCLTCKDYRLWKIEQIVKSIKSKEG